MSSELAQLPKSARELKSIMKFDVPAYLEEQGYDPVVKIHETLVEVEELVKDALRHNDVSKETVALTRLFLESNLKLLPFVTAEKQSQTANNGTFVIINAADVVAQEKVVHDATQRQ